MAKRGRRKLLAECNMDCFNCIHPDCINQSTRPTKWESEVMKYAHNYGQSEKAKGGRWSD